MQIPHDPTAAHSFSLAERDRRWGAVRSLMELAGIDVLIAAEEVNARYLSQMQAEAGPVVITADGTVAGFALGPGAGAGARSWITDLRPLKPGWAGGLQECLEELGLDRKIVGVTGLDSSWQYPNGNLNYLTFVALRELFPRARWVGASSLVEEVRLLKSAEEIEVLQRAALAGDAAVRAMAETGQVPLPTSQLWSAGIQAALQLGADVPTHIQLDLEATDQDMCVETEPSELPLTLGGYVHVTVHGSSRGYQSPQTHTFVVGHGMRELEPAWALVEQTWSRIWRSLEQGEALRPAIAAAPSANERELIDARVRAVGLGWPVSADLRTRSGHPDWADQSMQDGTCIAVDLTATVDHAGAPLQVRWSDTIVADPHLRRLAQRPMADLTA